MDLNARTKIWRNEDHVNEDSVRVLIIPGSTLVPRKKRVLLGTSSHGSEKDKNEAAESYRLTKNPRNSYGISRWHCSLSTFQTCKKRRLDGMSEKRISLQFIIIERN